MDSLAFNIAPTSVVLRIKLYDSTTDNGKTGLAYDTSGLVISTIQNGLGANGESSAVTYRAADNTIETISTLGTFAAPTSGYCRFKEIDATNQPGLYEIQFENWRWSLASDATKPMTLTVQVFGTSTTKEHYSVYECRTAASDVVSISGDITAADNFETMLDGTGGKKLTLSQLYIRAAADEHGIDVQGGIASGLGAAGNAMNLKGGLMGSGTIGGSGLKVRGTGSSPAMHAIGAPATEASASSGTGLLCQGGELNGIGFQAFGEGSAPDIMGADNDLFDYDSLVDDIWDEAATGHPTLGTMGGDLQTRASQTSVNTVDTVVDAIKAKTDNLPSDPADESLLEAAIATRASQTSVDTVDGIVDAIKAKTDNLPSDPADESSLQAAIATRASQASVDTVDGIVDNILLDTAAIDLRLPSDPADESSLQAAIATRASQASVDTVDGIVDNILLDTAAIDLRLPSDPADESSLQASIALLASQTSVDTIDGIVDAINTRLPADPADESSLQSSIALLASQTSVDTIDGIVDAINTRLPSDPADESSLQAAIATRASQTSVDTIDGIVDDILLDTAAIDSRLPSNPADESLLEAAIATRASQTSVDTVDTVVDAIKAKTDNLPSDPADESSLQAAIATRASQTSVDTVDGIVDDILLDTAAIDSRLPSDPADESSLQAAIATRASQTSVDTVDGIVDDILLDTAAIDSRLPSDPADESLLEAAIATRASQTSVDTIDTVADTILVDTNEIQGKLPTNYIMGSAVQTDKDDEIDAIKAQTDRLTFNMFDNSINADLTNIGGSTTVDGIAIPIWFEHLLSHAEGDIVRVGNTFTYKKQDGTTTTFTLTSSDNGRT